MVMKWSQNEKETECGRGGGGGGGGGAATSELSLLGSDQVLAILYYLPVQAVISFGLTCHRFRQLAETDALWAYICTREWGSMAVQAWPAVGKERGGWKRVYRQMLFLKAVSWHRFHQEDLWPTQRASHSMVAVAGKVAVYGGGCAGGRHLDDTWVAPLPSQIGDGVGWQQICVGIPSGRFGQSCTFVQEALVMFGGINDKGTRQCDTWVNLGISGPGSSSWQLLEVVSSPPSRGAHSGCYGGDKKVVIYGGIGSDGLRLGDTWMLDLAESPATWHEVITPVAPMPRSGHTLTWIGGKRMVLFGGRGTHFEVLNDVWVLDMEDEFPSWVELRACELQPVQDAPVPRAGHSATLIFGGRILIYGGEDARRFRKGDVWVLDPSAGVQICSSSSCIPNFSQRSDNSIGNKLARRFWKKLKQWGQPPSKRSFHGACALDSGHSILVFGGMVDGEIMPAATAGLDFDAELYMLQLVP
jgi:hypothetical protein